MIVAIVGSREFPDERFVRRYVNQLDPDKITVLSGGARGVDTWAVDEAKACGMDWEVDHADWDEDGKAAGFIRNSVE